jgi:Tfp pilus tip-associated adhesin PilY1
MKAMKAMKTLARPLTGLLLAWLTLSALPAVADSTAFSDLPLRTMNRAKPNILIAIDNGGSTARTYSPDTAITNLENYQVGTNYIYRDIRSSASSVPYTKINLPYNITKTTADAEAISVLVNNVRGDDDWHYRANDCSPIKSTVNGVLTQTGVSCPSGNSLFNRLYFHPDFLYTAPVDYNNRTLPTPAQVAANPASYTWYVTIPQAGNGGAYQPNDPASPLYGCNLGNTSIDNSFPNGNTSNTSSFSNPGNCASCDMGIRYDTCAWRDGFNPSLGTVNLRNNYSTELYPIPTGQLPLQYLPKLSNTEVVRPDGSVVTSAFDAYTPHTSVTGGYPVCTPASNHGYVDLIVCAPGTKPSTPVTTGTPVPTYTPNCAVTGTGSSVAQAWYWSACSDTNKGGTLTGPYNLGTLTSAPTNTSSPYYCDLSVFNANNKQNAFQPTGRLPDGAKTFIPCVYAKNQSGWSTTIYANTGPADYFENNGTGTSAGTRHPLMALASDGSHYTIVWNAATLNQFAIWHSFYRTRLLALKSSLGQAVNAANLNSNFRVGLATAVNGTIPAYQKDVTLSFGAYACTTNSTTCLDGGASKHYFSAVADFDASHKQEWYQQMQKIAPGQGAGSVGSNPDYSSILHAYYLWFTGTWADPAVPTGFLSQTAANSTASTGADSQYSQYWNSDSSTWVNTGHTGPAMYSCQPNILAYVASSVNAYTGMNPTTNIFNAGTNYVATLNNLTGTNPCSGSEPYQPPYDTATFGHYSRSVCDLDAGAVSLPAWLSKSNAYNAGTCPDATSTDSTCSLGYFFDATACKAAPGATDSETTTGACSGTKIYSDTAWPAPFKAPTGTHYPGITGSLVAQSSLAQLALYYWSRDLNEEFNAQKNNGNRTGNFPIAINYIPKWDKSGNRLGDRQGVPPFANDTAYWPHVTSYMVSLGVGGSYDYSTSASSNPITKAASLSQGSASYPWPALSYDTAAAEYLTTADDMAHAAAAGHGRFLSAYDSYTLKSAFGQLFTDILALSGSESAVAVANTQVSQNGISYAFQSSYNTSGWYGDVVASPIQSTTGLINTYTFDAATCAQPTGSSNSGWSAQCRLRETLCPGYLAGGSCTTPGSNNATARYIVTDNGSAVSGSTSHGTTTYGHPGVAFTSAAVTSIASDVIDYLRGNSLKEHSISTDSNPYRSRFQNNGTTIGNWNPMGDVVDAEAVVIGPPQTSYTDTGYAAWKATQIARAPVVFQGANDGMLHAFKVCDVDSAGHCVASTAAPYPGQELWAYTPSLVRANLWALACSDPTCTSTPAATLPHVNYINATPTFGDVYYASAWHTLLVGGLAKGGRGYYALDVTTPTATSQADAASKVMWVFPVANNGSDGSTNNGSDDHHSSVNQCSNTSSNMGYSYGRPAMVKVNGQWVVMVASGYDNGTSTGGDGNGHLYLLDPQTGICLADIPTTAAASSGSGGGDDEAEDDQNNTTPTPAGTAAAPSGLAHFAALVADPSTDQSLQAVYGGDLLGNVWKFVPPASGLTGWTVTKFADLKDANAKAQPVTSEPNVSKPDGSTVVVYVGTGRYLGTQDVPATSNYSTDLQTMYALMDDGATTYNSPARTKIQTMQDAYNTAHPGKNARYLIDGNTSGTWASCANGATVTQCLSSTVQAGLSANPDVHPWAFDLPSGERLLSAPVIALGALLFTSNQPVSDPCQPGGKSRLYMLNFLNGGVVAGTTFVSQNIVDPVTGYGVMASRPTIVQLPDGRVVTLISTSVGVTLQIGNLMNEQPARRVSWREVPNF